VHSAIRRAALALFTTLACVCPLLEAQSPVPASSAEGKATALLQAFAAKNGLPGAAAAVARVGQPTWTWVFGEADVEQHVPVRSHTLFRIGSLSKLLTAEGVVRLASSGKLDLDADIHKYVPSFPGEGVPITSRELAGHLAGIRHYRNDYMNTERFASVTDSLKRFENDPLVSPPNTAYHYSSFGYVLLGAVIEGASKQNYVDYIRSAILKPLGMKSTVPDSNRSIIEWRSRAYSKEDAGALSNGPYMDTSDRLPAGGYLSSVDDLVKFGLEHVTPGALSADEYGLLFTSQKTSSGVKIGVGFGWRIGTDSQGRPIFHHGGDTVGGRAFLLIYPEDQMVVVFLSNLSFAPFNEKNAEALADCFR
jgi:CubicO group peptidase (beta-lactamase class C family)